MNGNSTELAAPTSAARKHNLILEIGQGGMSRVYLASQRGPGGFKKLLVIKRLLPELAEDPEFLEMFLEEARLSARLNHSNIVQINEVGFDGSHHYMAMEYLEGQSLETMVRRAQSTSDPLPLNMHLRIIAEVCAGLHYAHELTDLEGHPINLVHRDVSPHNVFVTYNGQVKLLDFGIAKAADSSQQTRTGVLKGKCGYMAPEQFGGKNVDRRADIFAVGVMIWQAITGRRLWKGLSDIEIFQRLAAGDIASPLTVTPNLPAELVDVCSRALAMDPKDRYATAADLGAALEAYVADRQPQFQQRDIGKFVAGRFEDARAKVRAAIDAELQKNLSVGTNVEVPVLPIAESGDEEERQTGAAPEGTARMPGTAAGAIGVGIESSPMLSLPPTSGHHLPSAPVTWEPASHPPKKRGVLTTVIVVGLAVAALAAVGGIVRRMMRVETPVATTAASASVSSAAASNDELTELTVEASPSSASIFVDEVMMSSNPGSAHFLRDKIAHRVRAEAPGYTGSFEFVVYDQQKKHVVLHLVEAPQSARPVANGGPGARPGTKFGRPVVPPTAAIVPPSSTPVPAPQPAPHPTPKGGKPELDPNIWDNNK